MTRAELTEAVARAICAACGEDPDAINDGPPLRWMAWVEEANAALAFVAEAMRNANAGMLAAGEEADSACEGLDSEKACIVLWRAMLAASPLAEDKP